MAFYRLSDNVLGGVKGSPPSKAYQSYVAEGERLITQTKKFIRKAIVIGIISYDNLNFGCLNSTGVLRKDYVKIIIR